MKKTIHLKPLFIAVSAVIVLAITVTLLFVNGVFKSSAGDAPEQLVLKIGKYVHASGDESQYIEVFEDNTIQIFGLDFYEYTKNLPANLANEDKYTDEERENFYKTLKSMDEYFKQRHSYKTIPELELVVFLKEDGSLGSSGLSYVEDDTLEFNEDYIYVYRG